MGKIEGGGFHPNGASPRTERKRANAPLNLPTNLLAYTVVNEPEGDKRYVCPVAHPAFPERVLVALGDYPEENPELVSEYPENCILLGPDPSPLLRLEITLPTMTVTEAETTIAMANWKNQHFRGTPEIYPSFPNEMFKPAIVFEKDNGLPVMFFVGKDNLEPLRRLRIFIS